MEVERNVLLDVNAKNNILRATIRTTHAPTEIYYFFYLIKDNEVVDKQGWMTSNTFEWMLEESGSYAVQGYIKYDNVKEFALSCSIPYVKATFNIICSKGFEQWWKKADIAVSQSDSDITIIDCLGFVEEVMHVTKNMKEAIQKIRKITQKSISQCKGTTYWLFYDFSNTEFINNKIQWLLEECYAICRKKCSETFRIYNVIVEESHQIEDINNFYTYVFTDNLYDIINSIKIDYFCVDALEAPKFVIENGIATVVAKTSRTLSGDKFAYYLCKNGKVVEKTNYNCSCSKSWNINECGIYYACVFLKRLDRTTSIKTYSIYFSDNELAAQYHDFLDSPAPTSIFSKNIPFMPEVEPFCNFLLIMNDGSFSTFDEISGIPLNQTTVIGENKIYIYSEKRASISNQDETIYFSGRIFQNNKYYYGAKEVQSTLQLNFESNIGHYSCMCVNRQRISFYNDAFSFNRWFYYKGDNYAFVSNSYHLLLIAICKHGITLHIDTDKAKVTLSTVKLQLLSQNFSHKMDVEGVFQVPFYEKMIIDKSGCRFLNNSMYSILKDDKVYHEIIYKKKKSKCAKEIIHNLTSIIDDEHFTEISCDLTGGLDSRLVFAALTSITNSKNKIKINTHAVPNSQDLEIAVTLNDLYEYPFNDYSESIEYLPLFTADQMNRSFYIGTYFSKNLVSVKRNNKQRLELIGACGEILFRPYVARRIFLDNISNCTDEKVFSSRLFDKYSDLFVLDGKSIKETFVKYLSEELNQIPGQNLFERLDRHYLAYRHAYHFDTILDRMGYNHIMPLQSIESLKLHHYSFDAHRSIRLQLEMIEELNPLLLNVAFDNETDNSDAKELLKNKYECKQISLKHDLDTWKNAEKIRLSHRNIISNNKNLENDDKDSIKKGLLNHFHKLMNLCPELKESIGEALFYRFSILDENNAEITYWYNKITSLMDQILIFSNESVKKTNKCPSKTINLFGSCVTRDVFEYNTSNCLNLGQYIARQSILSAVSPSVQIVEEHIELDSKFQKRMVLMDLEKNTFEVLQKNTSDYLIIDLIDERFPLVKYNNSYFTASNEAVKGCSFLKELNKHYKRIANGKLCVGNDEMEEYIDTFCNKISSIYKSNKIIIHRALLVDYYEDKNGKIRKFDNNHIKNNQRINYILSYMYDAIIDRLPGAYVIDEMNDTYADERHKWGLAPMHFQSNYYLKVLNRLIEIIK